MNSTSVRRPPRTSAMVILALIILVPALVGFGTKFRELLVLVGDQDGAFSVAPVLNYLLVTFGFLLLFGWAVLHGMFRDVEGPKYQMMENEQLLDEEDHEPEGNGAAGEDWWRHGA